ncbi:MAG: hypothetical protein AVDCRST_MAG75-480 [uncultured Propionibacteriaceae bacterium]|uniref:Uncharacterized protein n=1 Tax=uncultured Propionibacteriaceae bacterium TaxID=257457 RepID=A0A6J4N268_9ACTN|nr:MAG: hypothetical protein AVDCRST_MAG75-480 [uncultured Propionibacteriaceae bacterium]
MRRHLFRSQPRGTRSRGRIGNGLCVVVHHESMLPRRNALIHSTPRRLTCRAAPGRLVRGSGH